MNKIVPFFKIFFVLIMGCIWSFQRIIPAHGTEKPVTQASIRIKTTEEFVYALGSNRIIFLEPGTYILPPYFLTIKDIEHLSIIGLGEQPVQILSPSKETVLWFHNVKHITIDNIKAGHTGEVDTCSSGVFVFTESSDIHISNSILFGSGYEGLVLSHVSRVNVINSTIENCVYGIMTIHDSSHILLRHIIFHRNNGIHLINISESSHVLFRDSTIHQNTCCSLFHVEGSSYVSIERSTITPNGYPKNLYCAEDPTSQHDGHHTLFPIYPPFTIIREPAHDDENCDVLKISVSYGTPFSLGYVCKNESGYEDSGIYLESLQVYKLVGNPDLLHIKWTNIGAGASGSYGGEFLVCLADHPETVLMSGFLPYYSAMGWGNWTQYSYRVEYEGDVLTFWTEAIKDSRLEQPEPLHSIIETTSQGKPFYKARIATRLTQAYVVKDIKLFPLKTILEYQIQEGDTREAICQGLNVEMSWMQLSHDLPEAGGWIQILIPNDVITEQAHDLWKKWDWWWDFRT